MTKRREAKPDPTPAPPVHVVVRLTDAERRALHHRAIDAGCSLGMLVREALGLGRVASEQGATMR